MLKITILVGNPKPQSRTLKLAETLVDELLVAGTYDLRVIDLAEYSSHIFEWPSAEMSALNQAVADSDLLVVASPTYKATYTGLLKSFLDWFGQGTLAFTLSLLLALPLVCILAELGYRFVERPGIALGRRIIRRWAEPSAPAAARA